MEEADGAPVGPEYDIHTMDITPKLKEGIAQGQPLFARQPMNQEINAPKFVDGAPGWFVPAENPFHRLRSLVQDKFLRVKVIQKSLAEAGAEITDDLDVYLLEELYYGKVAHDIERYQAEYVDPLVDAIARTGV